jgi:mercuric ion binding protein
MKTNLLLLLILSMLAFGYQNVNAADTVQTNNQLIQQFSVTKMTCKMCHITVSKAIKQVVGVFDAKVDYKTKVATVTFDPSIASIEQIEKATANAGYPATLMSGSNE